MSPPPVRPELGRSYTDDDGRTLVVKEIEPGSVLGREVRGRVTRKDGSGDFPYSTSIIIFSQIWRPVS